MVRLMTYNIQEGGGDGNRSKHLLAVIQRLEPDLLVLNEAVAWFPKHALADRLARLLEADYRIAPSASGFDIAFFSRFPIRKMCHPPIRNRLFHALAWIVVDPPGRAPLNLVGTHLDYREETFRVEEVRASLPHLAPLLAADTAILGDLNAISPDDPVMGCKPDDLARTDTASLPEWFLDRYPPRAMPLLARAGWKDAFRIRHANETGYTMSTSDPNARYDYILLSPSLAGKVSDVFVETGPPASNASDHFAVVADLAL